MNNQELHDILIKELGIGELPKEAQDEVIAKLGEIILKSLTVSIFDSMSPHAREKFEEISKTGDDVRIQEFLNDHVPNLHALMEEKVKKILQDYREGAELKPAERSEK